MATLRSILSRWVFVGVVFGASFIFMGAAFAPFSPLLKIPFDPTPAGFFSEPRTVSCPTEEQSSARRNTVLIRLEELILTQRALSTSV